MFLLMQISSDQCDPCNVLRGLIAKNTSAGVKPQGADVFVSRVLEVGVPCKQRKGLLWVASLGRCALGCCPRTGRMQQMQGPKGRDEGTLAAFLPLEQRVAASPEPLRHLCTPKGPHAFGLCCGTLSFHWWLVAVMLQ